MRFKISEMRNIEQVKKSIKESAAELFERFGYDKTTLEDIAARANKAKTAVYYHFGGKLDVLNANLEDEFNSVIDTLQTIRNEKGNEILPQFRAYLRKRIDLLDKATLYRRFIIDTLTKSNGEVAGIVNMQRSRFDRWEKEYFTKVCKRALQEGIFQSAVEPAIFGETMSTMLKGLELQYFISNNQSASSATYNEVMERMLSGFCK